MVEWMDDWMDDLIMKIRKTENCRKFSLKNGSKRAKINVFWPKIAVFRVIFLSGIGVYPPPPLTEYHSAQKSLVEWGVTPPPLAKKIRQVVFDSFP